MLVNLQFYPLDLVDGRDDDIHLLGDLLILGIPVGLQPLQTVEQVGVQDVRDLVHVVADMVQFSGRGAEPVAKFLDGFELVGVVCGIVRHDGVTNHEAHVLPWHHGRFLFESFYFIRC